MVVGYNHNFRYKGVLYHVQTEDSGVRNPHIVTLLYNGGTILVSQKTSYTDLLSTDNLELIVEEMMKTQHREMLIRLKNGDLDDQIRERLGTVAGVERHGDAPAAEHPARSPSVSIEKSPSPTLPAAKNSSQVGGATLEDTILSYFIGDQELQA